VQACARPCDHAPPNSLGRLTSLAPTGNKLFRAWPQALPDGLGRGYVDPAAPTELLTEQDFIDVKTAAEIVRLHTKVIRRAIDAGELTAYKLRTRIRRTDFDAWIEANRVQPSIHDIEPWQ
jgi:excisionase family DNA binding protein